MTETFSIVPAGGKPYYLVVPVLIFLVVVVVVVAVALGGALRASQSAVFEVSPEGLRLRGELLYRKWIPAGSLRGQAARVVDLARERDLAPRGRTFGTGLPGYGGGWFRLQGGEKALIYVTTRERVVYIPTTEGYSVLLSVDDPERMVARLREISPRP